MDVIAKCRVVKAYEKTDTGELTLIIGDVIEVLRKGRYIWYGRTGDSKGFFPSENVEIIEFSLTPEMKPENLLSTTAVADKGNSKNKAEQSDVFKEIVSTAPLKDKRRTRAKSTGRPPSQVFIKESKLQASNSLENLDTESDEESSTETQKPIVSISPKFTAISQLVSEMKQNSKLNTVTTVKKETTVTTVTSDDSKPSWLKILKKKGSAPTIPKKPENSDNTPPWMKEVIQKREHKLSLRGDETVSSDKTNQTNIEIQAYESRVTGGFLSEEQHIQTRTITSETTNRNYSRSSNTVSTRYSFTDDSADESAPTVLKKEKEVKMEMNDILKHKNDGKSKDSIELNKKLESTLNCISEVEDKKLNETLSNDTVVNPTSNISSSVKTNQSEGSIRNDILLEEEKNITQDLPLLSTVSDIKQNDSLNKVMQKIETKETNVIRGLPPMSAESNTKVIEGDFHSLDKVHKIEQDFPLLSVEPNIKQNDKAFNPLEKIIPNMEKKETSTSQDLPLLSTESHINLNNKCFDSSNSAQNMAKEEINLAEDPLLLSTKCNARQSDIIDSVEKVIQRIQDFQIKSEDRLKELRSQIQNIELSINHQYQEVTTAMEEIKAGLVTVINTQTKINDGKNK